MLATLYLQHPFHFVHVLVFGSLIPFFKGRLNYSSVCSRQNRVQHFDIFFFSDCIILLPLEEVGGYFAMHKVFKSIEWHICRAYAKFEISMVQIFYVTLFSIKQDCRQRLNENKFQTSVTVTTYNLTHRKFDSTSESCHFLPFLN